MPEVAWVFNDDMCELRRGATPLGSVQYDGRAWVWRSAARRGRMGAAWVTQGRVETLEAAKEMVETMAGLGS